MQVEIWSDVVCPFCYIGKRRFEQALARFEHRDEVEVVWRSYELDPAAPRTPGETTVEVLARKYGTDIAGARRFMAQADAMAAEVGLEFHHHEAPRGSTRDAHRLLHLALDEGRQDALEEALFDAYFTRAEFIADPAVLRRAGLSVGLPADRVDEVLSSNEYDADVDADVARAASYGATGVPLFVVDHRYGISGAQPVELFTQVLEKAWADSHPALDMVAGGEACGPDGCAV